jgi:hypothetical protein
MPRNPKNKRLEILLSPEQYDALLKQAEAEGFISIDPKLGADTRGAVSEYVRDLFDWYVPGFMKAAPIKRRGKYPRRPDKQIRAVLKKAGWSGSEEQAESVLAEVWALMQSEQIPVEQAVPKWLEIEYGVGEE